MLPGLHRRRRAARGTPSVGLRAAVCLAVLVTKTAPWGIEMLTRWDFSAAALVLLATALGSCATAPERPQGSFPLEWPRIPGPAAWAAQVPPGYRVEVVARDLTY